MQPLFNGEPFPVTIQTERQDETSLKVTLKALNTISYTLVYNSADGSVSKVESGGETRIIGLPDQMETERKIKDIIAKCRQIEVNDDGLLQFITDNAQINFDQVRDTFLAAVETRSVVPESYFQNGQLQSLFSGKSFPVTIQTVRQGESSLKVTLKALNTISYALLFNGADGTVTKVESGDETRIVGTPEQMETERKIKEIIAKCRKIEVKDNGALQFITDNAKINFDKIRDNLLTAIETRLL